MIAKVELAPKLLIVLIAKNPRKNEAMTHKRWSAGMLMTNQAEAKRYAPPIPVNARIDADDLSVA